MKVKTALVGINGYAQSHLNQLKQLVESGQIEFPAAVVLPRERTPENMAYFESIGCEVFDSLDEMFGRCARKPELVCLPTGISSHEPLTKCCLEHGANVLVEKPAAGSLEAVDRMRQGGSGIRVFRGGRVPAYLFPRVPENQKGTGIRQARRAEIHCRHGHLAARRRVLFPQ